MKGAIMSRRVTASRWWVLAAVVMLIGASCTFGPEEGPQGNQGTEGNGQPGGPVTLRVWTHQNRSFNRGLKALAADYTQEHPEVTFEFETFDYDTYIQTLQTALPAGTEADILQMFGTWTCSYADNLAPVPTDVTSLTDAQGVFFAAPLGGYVCDDALYGFPQEFNIEYGATLVNTAIAEAAGVDVTSGWDSWDAFREDAVAMTEAQDGAITRAGYHFTAADGLSYSFFSLILQGGGQFLSEDGASFTIDTPEARQALELLMSFVDAGAIDPVLFNDESNWVGDCYFEEACAMGLVGPWVVPEYAGDFPEVAENTVYVLLPTLSGSPDFVADSGWGLTVSSRSPAADTAWDFISFVALDEENAAEWNSASGTLPALKANAEGAAADALVAEFPHFEPWFPLLESGHYVGNLPDRDLLWYDIAYPHLLNALQRAESIDEALQAMEREANESFG
jgi:multiple sugar transport system substrate-binding protein